MTQNLYYSVQKTIIFSRQEHTCSARVAVIHGYRYLGNVENGWLSTCGEGVVLASLSFILT
jgi:hypothetical protein